MLVYFKLGNYKSIKEPVVINFNATAISEHQETNVLKKEKDELLRTVLLYGPNASGKSKILDGFAFFRWFIVSSATDMQSTDEIGTDPFALNTKTKAQPSFFEAEFYVGKTRYRYGFEADQHIVQKEWLLEVKVTTSTPIFLRHKQEFQINESKFKGGGGLEKRTRKNALFLSVTAQWNVKQAEQIIEWFDSIYTVHGMMDRNYRETTTNMLKDEHYEKLISELMRKADLGTTGIHALDLTDKLKNEILSTIPMEAKEVFKVRMENDLKPVFTAHNVYDDKGKVVEEDLFNLDQRESEGTKKFYNLAGVFVDAILSGNLVIVDEFDARLHTLLSKSIIQLFNSAGVRSEAQLLAVCHDTALLDKNQLRRDQIYFVEKDNYSATKVATLVEFKARKETPYYKNYLEGKYGAIPFIENLENVLAHGKES